MLPALAEVMLPYLDKPFAFYGHRLGALLAFEAARYLRREHGLNPAHLFFAAWFDPVLPNPYPSDDESIQAISSITDLSESISQELMPLLSSSQE